MIDTSKVKVEELRVSKLRAYLLGVIDALLENKNYNIRANMLSNEPNNYSLDKIPTSSTSEKWLVGILKKDIYSFRSRMNYSQDTIESLLNVGFFEIFEQTINSNNKKGILPDIDGIQTIECLNCGSMTNATTSTAEFSIQIRIQYIEEE